jgi:hypothetical protein
MSTRAIFVCIAAANCLLQLSCLAKGDTTNILTKAQFLALVPDLYDKDSQSKIQNLVAAGETLYPALVELLDQQRDPHDDGYYGEINLCVELLPKTKGDKTLPIEATKRLLARIKGSDERVVDFRNIVIRLLGKIGRPEDLDCIMPYLEDGDKCTRIEALRGVANLGSQANVKRIQEFIDKKKGRPNADKTRKDPEDVEAEKAIEALRNKPLDCSGPGSSAGQVLRRE